MQSKTPALPHVTNPGLLGYTIPKGCCSGSQTLFNQDF